MPKLLDLVKVFERYKQKYASASVLAPAVYRPTHRIDSISISGFVPKRTVMVGASITTWRSTVYEVNSLVAYVRIASCFLSAP